MSVPATSMRQENSHGKSFQKTEEQEGKFPLAVGPAARWRLVLVSEIQLQKWPSPSAVARLGHGDKAKGAFKL